MNHSKLFASKDLLIPNARIRRSFTGKIIGRFQRTGPNSWDPYTLKMIEGDVVTVHHGLKVYLDPSGPLIRMRRKGAVVVVEWIPDDGQETHSRTPSEMRQMFVDQFVAPFANKRGFGAAAEIARKLSR